MIEQYDTLNYMNACRDASDFQRPFARHDSVRNHDVQIAITSPGPTLAINTNNTVNH